MASRWAPGADEFSPHKCAASIRAGLSGRADEAERQTITATWKYHLEYLQVTAHGNGNRPSPMGDGTVVFYSWQAATLARFFCDAYGDTAALADREDIANALAEWRAIDWDARWEAIESDQRRYAALMGV